MVIDYKNTPTVFNQNSLSIDRDSGLISDIVIAQLGDVKGHNYTIDQTFLDSIVTEANKYKAGIKARFGHPNICNTALGTYLGRFHNYRSSNGSVHADLHLDSVAKSAPQGNLYDYVFDMAENNPDMFGASIAFKQDKIFTSFQTVDGVKKEIKNVRLKSLFATDFVDSPAATNSLFSDFHADEFSYIVTTFLDDNPEIFDIVNKNPDVINVFFNRYKSYKMENSTINKAFSNVKNWITTKFDSFFETMVDIPEDDIKSLRSDFEHQLQTLSEQADAEIQTLSDQVTNLNKDLATSQSYLNQLKASKTGLHGSDPSININRDKPVKSFVSDAPSHFKRSIKSLPKK